MRFEKAENIIKLAYKMQGTSEGVSLNDIGQEFACSRKTAERMRDAVCRLFPQTEQVETGERIKRWRIPFGALNSLIGFSAVELAQLSTAVAILRRDHMETQAEELHCLEDKIKAITRNKRRIEPDLEVLLEAEGLAMRPGPNLKTDRECIFQLRNAMISYKMLQIDYFESPDKPSKKTIAPYGFLYGNKHYLIAYSMRSRDYRLYILSNIKKIKMLDRTFIRDKNFSLKKYAEKSFGVFQEEEVYDVVWKFNKTVASDASEYMFHPSQSFKECDDGGVIVSFKASGLKEMCWHLFTWGAEVEILEPDELKGEYKKMLAAIRT